jgi:raffinose/stachyose/melibiose transport system permease protein
MVRTKEVKLGGDALFNIAGTAILILAIISSVYPLIWMLLNSFRTNDEMFLKPLSLPSKINFSVFVESWQRANFNSAFINSVINSLGAVLLVLVTGSPAAFSLARMKFPGNQFIIKLMMASIIISGQLILIPLFFVMKNLGVYNTLLSTIFSNAAMALPLCIYLFYGFFSEIPYEIEESAMIDGSSRWTFYYRFIIPLSKPIISTIIIFVSLWSWNEYLFALTFLKEDSNRTIPLQLQNFIGRWSTEYDMVFAALSISIVPILAIYIFLQQAFIKGLTAGAVKM